MVKTGRRVELLREHLAIGGLEDGPAVGGPSLDGVSEKHLAELHDLYGKLGGLEDYPVFRPGKWDLSLQGGLVVELDEELHFNRYRERTLETSWSAVLPWRDAYRIQSIDREKECLRAGRWGKRWTNPSTARMFDGGEPGDLVRGAPRWKQRALYDSIKDLIAAAGTGVRLARVSIYDNVGGQPLEAALGAPPGDVSRELVLLVEDRTHG